MKKIVYILSLVVIFFLNLSRLNAQIDGSHLMFDLGGGVHTMLYDPHWGENKIGMGGKIGLNYAYYFNQNFGFGLGSYCSLYSSKYKVKDFELSDGKKQIDDLNYDYTYVLYAKSHLNETERVVSLYFPISFRTQFQIGWYWDMRVNVGASIELPLLKRYYTEGDVTTSAYYEELNILFHDMPNHGFMKEKYSVHDDFITKKVGISPFIDLGFSRMIDSHWRFYLGVYASLSAMNLLKDNENPQFYDSTSDRKPQNAFASDLSESMRLFKAGAAIGFIYQFREDNKGNLVQTAQFELDSIIPAVYDVKEEEPVKEEVVVSIDTTCEDVVDINWKWLADSTAKAEGLKGWNSSSSYNNTPKRTVTPKVEKKPATPSNEKPIDTTTVIKQEPVVEPTQEVIEEVKTEEPVSPVHIEEDVPSKKIGDVTVRTKKIKVLCSNGISFILEYTDPGDGNLTSSMKGELLVVANILKTNASQKVTLTDESQYSGMSKYVKQKNMLYFSKIKRFLLQYGARPEQVVYGDSE